MSGRGVVLSRGVGGVVLGVVCNILVNLTLYSMGVGCMGWLSEW